MIRRFLASLAFRASGWLAGLGARLDAGPAGESPEARDDGPVAVTLSEGARAMMEGAFPHADRVELVLPPPLAGSLAARLGAGWSQRPRRW